MRSAQAVLGVTATALRAEDGKVSYRERTGKGGVLTVSGRIDSESLAGVKVAGKTIPSSEVIEIAYDVPGAIRLDYRSAAAEVEPPAEVIKEYEGAASRRRRCRGQNSSNGTSNIASRRYRRPRREALQ